MSGILAMLDYHGWLVPVRDGLGVLAVGLIVWLYMIVDWTPGDWLLIFAVCVSFASAVYWFMLIGKVLKDLDGGIGCALRQRTYDGRIPAIGKGHYEDV